MMRLLAVLALLTTAAQAPGAPTVAGFTRPAAGSPPFTYCIEYNGHPTEASYLAAIAKSPPDLYHVGYHIPFKGMLGPTYGHDLFTNELLAPADVPREIARVRDVIAQMRAAGVGRLIPYVYSMAFFGNPQTRTGFFQFYDRWSEYAAYGFGPRPADDPATWQQAPAPGALGPDWPGVLHYQPCVNNPGWLRYLDVVVRELTRCGYDGMFFDVNTQYCYCRHCTAGFRAYLLRKYGASGLQAAVGTRDAARIEIPTIYRDFEKFITGGFPAHLKRVWGERGLAARLGAPDPATLALDEDWRLLRCTMHGSFGEFPPRGRLDAHLEATFGATSAPATAPARRTAFVQTVLRDEFRRYLESPDLAAALRHRFGSSDIRRRCIGTPARMLLWVETQRFWSDSMAAVFARMKRVGRAAMAEAGRPGDFITVANAGSMSTLDGEDKRRVDGIDIGRWAPHADMQMLEEMQQCGMLSSGAILANTFGLRWAEAAGTRAGTLLYQVRNEPSADLAHAEIAANGGGAFIQTSNLCPESRTRWKRFYADRAGLWRGASSAAKVGIAYFHDQMYFENTAHSAMVRRLVGAFSENQTPFDLVVEENLRGLDRYDVVVAPELQYLSAGSARALLGYARRGGRLLVLGRFGAYDELARPRRPILQGRALDRVGRGRVLRLPEDAAPARASEFWNLMEERGGSFVRARTAIDAARQAANRRGEDTGARFIATVEQALRVRLRWTPVGTPAGLYLTAYAAPATVSRREAIVLHAVNYGLPLALRNPADDDPVREGVFTLQDRQPVPVKDPRIAVPLPPGWKSVRVVADSPTEPAARVRCTVRNGVAVVTAGEVKSYQSILLVRTR